MTARDDYPALAQWPDGVRALDEIDQLRRWKSEALTVLGSWDDVWRALGEPGRLGDLRTTASVDAVHQLRGRAEAAEAWEARLAAALFARATRKR